LGKVLYPEPFAARLLGGAAAFAVAATAGSFGSLEIALQID